LAGRAGFFKPARNAFSIADAGGLQKIRTDKKYPFLFFLLRFY